MKKTLISLQAICAVLFMLLCPSASAADIVPAQQNGIFEQQNEVIYNIENYTVSGSNAVSVTVKDYFGDTVLHEQKQVTDGNLNLGRLDTGWYRVSISDNANNLLYSGTMSVVPQYSQRYHGDSPFATDFATTMLVDNADRIRGFSRAAKLAGVSWIRERFSWGAAEAQRGQYDYRSFENYVNIEHNDGLRILNNFAGQAGYHANTQDALTGDLFDIYNFMKNTASHFGNRVGAWELWNEEDGGFSPVAADMYAAFYKAGALGVRDADSDAEPIFGGLHVDVNTSSYPEQLLKNDIMNYTNAYNFHAHVQMWQGPNQDINMPLIQRHIDLAEQYAPNAPLWITEAGMALPYSDLSDTNLTRQARYIVTSTVESLSQGTDKHFWFIMPKYPEGSFEFGSFDENDEPYPVYAAQAVLTNVLKQGIYKGELNIGGARGYLFNNGEKDVLVVWASSDTNIDLYTAAGAELVDIMGRTSRVSQSNGRITVTVGNDPKYVVFDGELNGGQYTAKSYEKQKLSQDTDKYGRIIIQPDFADADHTLSKECGHFIKSGEENKVDLTVYNFNNTSITGSLQIGGNGISVRTDNQTLTIGAMSKIETTVYIRNNGGEENQIKDITFQMVVDGKQTSPTVSAVVFMDNEDDGDISVSGIENGAVYSALTECRFSLPADAKNIQIRLNGNSHTNSYLSGSELKVFFTNLEEGDYTLCVYVTRNNGYLADKTISFSIEKEENYKIHIEGENLTDQFEGYRADTYVGTRVGWLLSSAPREFNINFDADYEGMYTFSFRATKNTETISHLGAYCVELNGQKWSLTYQQSDEGDFAIYSLPVFLNKGTNNIKFIPTKARPMDNQYLIFLDYVSFEKADDTKVTLTGINYTGKGNTTRIEYTVNRAHITSSDASRIEYVLYAPSSGLYGVKLLCSAVDSPWTSDFIITINDEGQYPANVNTMTMLSPGDGSHTECTYIYNNTLYLERGMNTLVITTDPADTAVPDQHTICMKTIDFVSLPVSTMRIEGEDLQNQSEAYFVSDYQNATVGCVDSSQQFSLNIDFYAEKSGLYDLKFRTTQNTDSYGWLNPYFVTLNGKDWTVNKADSVEGDYGIYSTRVWLNKGKNNIKFTPASPRPIDNHYLLYLDYLVFEEAVTVNADFTGTTMENPFVDGMKQTGVGEGTHVTFVDRHIYITSSTPSSVEYFVYAPADGDYSARLLCSQIDSVWTNDFILSVNDTNEYRVNKDTVSLISLGDGSAVECTYDYIPAIHLKQGYNKLVLKSDEMDTSMPSGKTICLTSITFSPQNEVQVQQADPETVVFDSIEIENGNAIVSVASRDGEEFDLILAEYDGKKLTALKTRPTELKPYLFYQIQEPVGSELVACFAWSSISEMKPLSK